MKHYDIIIIGSGLGGLMCGNILSKEGYRVCILEKHHQIGGCLQTFKRDNCIFDSGMHFIGSMEPGDILNQIFTYAGIRDKLKLKKLDSNVFDKFGFDYLDDEFDYAMGYENFIETLAVKFPNDKKALVNYCSKTQEIINSLNVYNLREMKNTNIINSDYLTQSAFDFICETTDNKVLVDILSACNPLYAGSKNKSPVYMHASILHSFITNSYRLVDGGDQIGHLLADTIRSNGGDIYTRHTVSKFISGSGKLTAVEINNKEQLGADHFISNIHPVNTLKMIDSPLIRKPYRKRIYAVKNTISSFTLFVSLKENSFEYLNYNYYHSKEDTWSVADYSEESWPKGYMLITPATSKSSVYADCIIILTYMHYEDVKKWEHTTTGKRGDDYLDFKMRKAEKLLDYVEKRFPDFRSKIVNYYTSTPLTYRDYTGTVEGSLYGIEKDCNNPIESYIPPKTKIPNLYFTGQNINMHGVLGVSIGAMLTSAEFLGINNVIRKIQKG